MKKLLSLVMIFAMVLTAACVTATAEIEPFGEGKTLTFSCLEGWYSAVSINDQLPIWQEFEKRTGVHIEFEAIADYDTAMLPRVAAGQELPDIFLVTPSWGNGGVYKMALDGIIIPLDDLIAEYAPNITKLLNDNPKLKGLLTAPDGVMYTVADVPMFVNDVVMQNAFFVREDWLEALGLEAPATLEDWHNVLSAFKGYTDTAFGLEAVPFSNNGSISSRTSFFTCAFDLPCQAGMWWYDENGEVFFTYTTEEYKNYLTEMNKWYAEGLFDVEVRDESNFNSLVSTDVVGATAGLSGYWENYNGLIATTGSTGGYILVNPPASKDKLITKRDSVWNHYGITKYCDDPVTAIKWIDYVWGSDEGVTLNEWGFEGMTFEYDEAGNKYYTDYVRNKANPNGLDPYNALRELGASDTILVRTPAEVYDALVDPYVVEYDRALMDQRVEPFPAVMATDEEQEIIDRINPDLSTYCNEMIEKFITGQESLDNFDQFAQKVVEIGMEELMAVRQAQFDRSGTM